MNAVNTHRVATIQEPVASITSWYLPYLERGLTPPRLQHSLSVTGVMADLVAIYGLDAPMALTAALLHDAAKDLPDRCLLKLAREACLSFQHPCERHAVYLHAPVGAYLARRDLEVTDVDVLDAIAGHSHVGWADRGDGLLSWCLRFADVLAPSRPWPGEDKLRRMVYSGRLEESALLLTHWLLEWLQWHGIPAHPQIASTRDALAKIVGVGAGTFDRS